MRNVERKDNDAGRLACPVKEFEMLKRSEWAHSQYVPQQPRGEQLDQCYGQNSHEFCCTVVRASY